MDQLQLSFYEENKARTLEAIRRTARHICYEKGSVTTDDIREHMGDMLPSFLDMRIMGAALGDKSMFQCVGYTKTRRKSSHGRPIGIFKIIRKQVTAEPSKLF